MFNNPAETVLQYFNDPKFMDKTLRLSGSEPVSKLQEVYECLVKHKPQDFADCVKWARLRFQVSLINFLNILVVSGIMVVVFLDSI